MPRSNWNVFWCPKCTYMIATTSDAARLYERHTQTRCDERWIYPAPEHMQAVYKIGGMSALREVVDAR